LAVGNLCMAFLLKGDWDGMIEDLREALRLNPNNDNAHYQLGAALEKTRNRQEAFQEYRAAYELKPQNPDYQEPYERLLKHVKR
jgi:Flp pilus assembly protein TadD